MHHAHIDKFAYQDSWIHRLDGRVKFVVTLLFTLVVFALGPTTLIPLFFCMIGPFTVLVLANIPLRFVAKHLLIICPFILALALSCVWFDRQPATFLLGPFVWHTHTGTLRALNIIGKFSVTMTALIALISTTRFSDLLVSLQRLHVPQVLITQLGFLYRYLFVLIDTAHHLLRARTVRRLRYLGLRHELGVAVALIGSLLTRSFDHAEGINRAMQARGFTGRWPTPQRSRLGRKEFVFLGVSLSFLALLLTVLVTRGAP